MGEVVPLHPKVYVDAVTENGARIPYKRCCDLDCIRLARFAVDLVDLDSGENAGSKFYCEEHAREVGATRPINDRDR